MPVEAAEITRIADAIEGYLNAHPSAADTVEGIRQWWIAGEYRHALPCQVQAAIDTLLAQGRLVRRVLPDSSVVYSRLPESRH